MYSPPEVDRTWGVWGSYCNTPNQSHILTTKRGLEYLGLRHHVGSKYAGSPTFGCKNIPEVLRFKGLGLKEYDFRICWGILVSCHS